MSRNINKQTRFSQTWTRLWPALLYNLTIMPLATFDLNQLDAIQRRMLRSLVGWGQTKLGETQWFVWVGLRGHVYSNKMAKTGTIDLQIIFSICDKGRWDMWVAKTRGQVVHSWWLATKFPTKTSSKKRKPSEEMGCRVKRLLQQRVPARLWPHGRMTGFGKSIFLYDLYAGVVHRP